MSELEQPYTIEKVKLKRIDDKVTFTIDNPLNKSVKIFMGKQPRKAEVTQLIAEGESNHFEAVLPQKEAPYYFFAIVDQEETTLFGERILPLEGTLNLRDLGGYSTKDGKVVSWGKLYRSDHLTKLTEDDIDVLEKIGIKTVVDLRSDHERSVYPNKEIGSVKWILKCNPESHFAELAGQAINLEDENQRLVDDLEKGVIDSAVVNDLGLVSKQSYEKFVEDKKSQEAFGEMLKWLANPESIASIHHCRGGKDRTGYGSMLILSLLGVDEKEIIQDYMITKAVREERNQIKLAQYKKLTTNQNYLDYLMSLIDTREDYLMAAMEKINLEYGGVKEYALKYLGLTEEEIENMKKIYLEE